MAPFHDIINAASDRPVWIVLSRHWLSMIGAELVTTAIITWLFVLPISVRGHAENPYLGIVIFLIVPAIFFVGLVLIPIGIYLGNRQIRLGLAQTPLDRKTVWRRLVWFFGITTLANVLLGTQFTYRAVKHMETPQFCGATCHVMAPEFAAYRNAPHSSVECVGCHVVPTGSGWLHAKVSGTRQLFEVALNNFPRPIPSALESNRLVPAKETCENCHWSNNFGAVRLRVFSKYADDEANTRTETVLMMMIGGSRSSGIHGAHFGPGIQIRFAAADPARQTIPWVEYRNAAGKVTTYVTSSSQEKGTSGAQQFEMQCVDCHNRPSHAFDLPDRAMDKAMALGDIPVSLPFIKKKGVEVLKATYGTSKEAADKLPQALINFYQEKYPTIYAKRSQDVRQAAQAVLAMYNRNVFPDLKVGWGTYPNNIGHTDFPGCFRCHDGSHESKEGNSITQDCGSCHESLATDEASPEILKTLGIAERISKIQKH